MLVAREIERRIEREKVLKLKVCIILSVCLLILICLEDREAGARLQDGR